MKRFIPIALIIILGTLVYVNSINGKFVWDDDFLVKDNVYVKNWSNVQNIFTKDCGAGAGLKYHFYRPILTLTYLANYSMGKLDVKGYHITNILLHVLVSLILYKFIGLLYNDRSLSFLTAIFFVVHPIHAEAVAYISGRGDSLAALFMLLSFVFYIKYLHIESVTSFILVLLCYSLAILSKENSLIFPMLLLLYHYSFKKRIKAGIFTSLVSIVCIYIVFRLAIFGSASFSPLTFMTTLQRIPGFFVAVFNYIRLLILPLDLHMGYGDKTFSPGNPMVILGGITFFSLLIYSFKHRDKNHLFSFSVFWFFIALLPASNIYPLPFYMAEHYLYLPSIGFFLILSKGLSSAYAFKKFRIFTVGVIISLLCFYSYLTIKQNYYWREPVAFYKRLLKYVPCSSWVYNNLGVAYDNIGKKEEAFALFKKAIEIDRANAYAYYNLAKAHGNLGNYEEAIKLYKKAAEIKPDYGNIYCNLGAAYNNIGKREKAIISLEKAIEFYPDDPYAYNNLATVHNSLGNHDKAIKLYKKAIKIEPDYLQAHNNLGIVYKNIGNKKGAIEAFKRTIEIDPNNSAGHYQLAVLYYEEKQYDFAFKHFNTASKLGYKVDSEFLKKLKSTKMTQS